MTVLKFLQLKEKESLDNLLILSHLVSEKDGLLTVKGLKWRLGEGPLSCPVFCGAGPLCLRPLLCVPRIEPGSSWEPFFTKSH